MIYRPPPAHAQAHPAQAHAQAHECPPPPEKPPLLAFTTGTGLVRLVTPEVKDFTSPNTLLENPWTPVTTEAAKAEPGRLTEPRPPDGAETEGVEPVETGW
jgi:hypothetical protein